ncbi:SNF2-related protein [Pseudoalteromonas ruthenica]|uniref:SNF2-related protein n=1 Tax=Pseudoalteromonas ruthenica TaxID=151081 RepID=UPI00110A14B9|nr:SNF2-related protein [Pseudoalteromonas ruthenica]TMO87666.1 hypothetical protein CWC12_10320 [Pseudoalteromonas ruthenica]TMP22257.1 hypothetical protein CWC06_15690 [Pseudoalteromonas ruthenica]
MTQLNRVFSAVANAMSAIELADVLGEAVEHKNNVSFGVVNATKKKRKEANAEAITILERVGTDHTRLTEEDKDVLRKYSGLGGIGGSVHEYYTPQFIAEGVWDLLKVNGLDSGNVCEPSAGAGVFNGTKPKGVIITGSEMDATSSQINQLLHPEDKIFNKTFEQLCQNAEDHSFDGFTGNVPFSKSRSTAHDDPEYQNIKQAERYFITRMIDKVKYGGLISCVVPTQIIDRKSWDKWRKEISLKAEFLGAHRLPAGVFKDNGTDVSTDVIVLRKHSEELTETIAGLDEQVLLDANVIYTPFVEGRYFKTTEGKRFVHGTVEQVKGQFGSLQDVVKKDSSFSQQGIKEKLSRKFDSRIDYESLAIAEPVIHNYIEGDEKKINGRWHNFKDGEWQVKAYQSESDAVDTEKYGVSSVQEIGALLRGDTTALLDYSYDQVQAMIEDYEYLIGVDDSHRILDLFQFANSKEPQYRERVLRGSIIGDSIIDLQNQATQMRRVPTALAAQLRERVSDEIERYGITAADKKIANFAGTNSNPWNAFANATDTSGELSDLLKGSLDVGETLAFDTNDASQVITHLHNQFDLNPVPFDEFEKLYTGRDKPKSLSDVAMLDGVAITADGDLMPFDRATSGDIVKKVARISKALGQETDQAIKDNYERQLAAIEGKRKRNNDKEIEFSLNAKWIPRKYVTEFLEDAGYTDFSYTKAVENAEGEIEIVEAYEGEDGVFVGYTQHKNGKKRANNANIAFERQLEKHLNGLPVQSKDSSAAARYKDRIKVIDQQFADWLRQHTDIDEVTDKYNDVFNGHIPFEHSNTDLGLTGVSENVQLMDYQNSGIRRISEDGRGILADDTGLGKTFSALGLVAYNRQLGRSKRTCIVVPKAVLENWYHEIVAFYGHKNMGSIIVPAIQAVKDKGGNIEQELILDENGKPKLNQHTQKEQYRDKIKVITNAKVIKEKLSKIPQSNFDVVVLTKEQYAKLPIRPESIAEHVSERVSAGALKGKKYVANAKTYREAQKNESFKAKYNDVGTAKYDDVPYYEDMGFDTVIVDEGHNYRNSYAAGYKASRLAYLPTAPSSDVAIDMALKSEYLRRKNGGRGTVLLTATPTVNSPTDIYNMLSLVLSPDEWSQMGIVDVDDFIELYGEVENETITKLSGAAEEVEALVGFKNLTGLRNLFHRWVLKRKAKDVSATVKVPDLVESKVAVDLTEEQQRIYEELRERADQLNEKTVETDVTLPNGEVVKAEVPNGDTIFGIIRDMDRVATDIDLYNKTMTFVLPKAKEKAINEAIANLPETLTLDGRMADKEGEDADVEKFTVAHNAEVSHSGNSIVLVVHEAFEDEVIAALTKAGVKENTISHPVAPKYARLIELMREGLKDGKQIVFTEEKTQHNKLKRMISHQLGIDAKEVGIINADTVAGKKKKASADDQEAGLEKIANAFNTGVHRVLIANKKAEVGVNLHHGTSDLYHLTLPWTPASIDQRNGRGARVGSKRANLRVHYMLGKGSFDEYRLSTLMRKKQWMHELFTSNDEKMKNADAVADSEEMGLLLARDPAERAARAEVAKKEREANIKREKKRLALVDVANYIKASHAVNTPINELESQLKSAQEKLSTIKGRIEHLEISLRQSSSGFWDDDWRTEIKNLKPQVKPLERDVRKLSQAMKAHEKAGSKKRQLKPQVEKAIADGLIDEKDIIADAHNCLFIDNRILRVGEKYNNTKLAGTVRNPRKVKRIVQITSVDVTVNTVEAKVLFTTEEYGSEKIGDTVSLDAQLIGTKTSVSKDELRIKAELRSQQSISGAMGLLDESQFKHYLKTKELELKYGETHIIARGSEGFAVKFYKELEEGFEPVYLSRSNESLKKEIAQWLLADNQKALNSEGYNAKESLIYLFGNDYVEAVQAYGNQASDAQIHALIEKFESSLSDEQVQGIKDQYVSRNYNEFSARFEAERIYRKGFAVPPEYDNIKRIEELLEKRSKDKANALIAIIDAERERKNELLRAKVATEFGKSIDAVKERIDFLVSSELFSGSSGLRDKIENGFTVEGQSAYHSMSEDDRYCALYADMKRIGLTSSLRDNIKNSVIQTLTSTYSFSAGERARAKERWIDMLMDEPSEADKVHAEKASEVVEKAGSSDGEAGSVKIIVNAKEIKTESRKVKMRGRWRTQRGAHHEAGAVYCLHDPKGKDGMLFKRKNELKELAGKGNYSFATDLTDDYPESWWFVNVDAVKLEDLKALFEE